MIIFGHVVKGALDAQTRCAHYHSPIDRIAIKFYCCNQYFPCYQCHEAYGCNAKKVWPIDAFDHKAILCGGCGFELAIHSYLQGENHCPSCGLDFNPNCSLHKHLYFEVK